MRYPDLDTEFVRAHFPAFGEPGLRHWTNFDNASASFACRYVVWRLSRYYRERLVAPFGPAEPSRLAGEEVEDARISLAQLLGVQSDEIGFGPSTAQNAYVLARAVGEMLPEGATLILTDQDVEGHAAPWRHMARGRFRLREWRMRPDGRLDSADLADLLDDSVALLCFPHCSTILGHVNDAAAIARLAKSAGAVVCIDGEGMAPHALPQPRALGADIYLFSAGTSFGPRQGIFYLRHGLAMELPPQVATAPGDPVTARFVPAGPDHAQIAACAGLSDYIDALYAHHFSAGRDAKGRAAEVGRLIRARETALVGPVIDWLRERTDLRLLGGGATLRRVPILSLDLPTDPRQVQRDLARRGLMVGAGALGAPRSLAALGVPQSKGVLRLSMAHYNTREDVDRLLAALDETV